jgi:hypothetical protein
VYCSKCGTKNQDDAELCTKCGASLKIIGSNKRRIRRHREEECFGLPHGGTILGLLIGIIIILWGLTQIPGIFPEGFQFWWLIIIVFGILIIAGSLYRTGRR